MDNHIKNRVKKRASEYLNKSCIVINEKEFMNMEVTDFGLGYHEKIGLQLVVYINTKRVCAKELILFPGQICPEHKHPPINNEMGKEETFRCRWGTVYLYIPGKVCKRPKASIPKEFRKYFTVFHEIILNPGDQYTLKPETLHWFQAGNEGAVVSEFSTTSRDEYDIFTDPGIKRIQ
ncbi:MAG: D-lyxose/D-mannose family sugar isomerase [Kosmotogaceae bacterium]